MTSTTALLLCLLAALTAPLARGQMTQAPPPETCAEQIMCVTGGTGFLGLEVVAQLLERGYQVKATARSLSNEAKLRPLRALGEAAEGRLTIVEADLLSPGSFDECARGASVVFHTASPFRTSGVVSPEEELIKPAVEGTENVLASATASSIAAGGTVRRVVLTSSIAAIMGSPKDKASCFDEDDWNFSSSLDNDDGLDWYRLSKTLAERRAWDLVDAHNRRFAAQKAAAGSGGSDEPSPPLELTSICPSVIVGPPRTPRADSESLQLMGAVLDGSTPTRGASPMVDVRDAAAMHVAAAEADAAVANGKRFLATTESPVDPTAVVAAAQRSLTEKGAPAASSPSLGSGKRRLFCSKNAALLGLSLRPIEDSLEDMARTMRALR